MAMEQTVLQYLQFAFSWLLSEFFTPKLLQYRVMSPVLVEFCRYSSYTLFFFFWLK